MLVQLNLLSWLDMNINEKSLAVSVLVHDGM